MDAIKNLPAPLRYGIPVTLVIAIGLVAWLTVLRPPAPTVVVSTQDIGVIDTAKRLLENRRIDYDVRNDNGNFSLEVASGDSTDAAEALAGSGIKDRTGLAKKITCPAPPGFTATRAANERSANCEDASRVQAMLMTAGAIAANVSVSQEENGTLLGPEKSKNVVAQVFLPAHMKGEWNAEQAAGHISKAVGTSMDRVSIADDELQTLYDGASSAGSGSAGGAASGSSACGDMDTATEIETKKDAVRACYEWRIGTQLTKLLGGSDRYVLTVEPTIQSVASSVTEVTNTPGPVVDASAQKSSDSSARDVTKPANVKESTRVIPAGAISSLRITATLDRDNVSADQQLAVKRMLSTFVDPRRRDPAPIVSLTKFQNGAGEPASEELAEIKTAAEENASSATTTAAGAGLPPVAKTEMPTWALALMAALVIGIVTAVLVLWRRSAAMAAERSRLEESFRNEQRLFEDFAQQNPDQLAQDLNALFGAPAAPEPTYR